MTTSLPATPTSHPDVTLVGRIEAVPRLLEVICETTGMGFAAVARVDDHSWTACAVRDAISFGLKPGEELPVHTTLCIESRAAREPIVFDHASVNEVFRDHHTPRIYNIQSYITVPIVLPDGEYFGNLCAIDPNPANPSNPSTVALFKLFAELIAVQLVAERRREQAQAELMTERQVGELRDHFVAILGHDLRNPLAAIHANAMVLDVKAGAELRDYARRILSNANRMAGIIEDVLDLARGRLGGGLVARIEPVEDLAGRLEAVVRELQDAHPGRVIEYMADVSGTVQCDSSRVQQLLSNLVGNAIKHGSQTNAVLVSVALRDGEVVISVKNDGDPIPQDAIDQIFSPFWRKSQGRDGLGLGLYICSQITAAHGGRLGVVSSSEAGTTFTATIPARTTRSGS